MAPGISDLAHALAVATPPFLEVCAVESRCPYLPPSSVVGSKLQEL